ncbi:hypothetical protein D3C78_686120 [compost metagenome]
MSAVLKIESGSQATRNARPMLCGISGPLAEQLQALEALKGDAILKQEMEVETKLRALLAKYGYCLKDIIKLLDPKAGRRAPAAESKSSNRKPRQVKVYKNPESGEVVETKGGNHKILKEWKARSRRSPSDFGLSTKGPVRALFLGSSRNPGKHRNKNADSVEKVGSSKPPTY